jgi:hypothetical protein
MNKTEDEEINDEQLSNEEIVNLAEGNWKHSSTAVKQSNMSNIG